MKHNSYFVAPASIDEMLKVLTNSKRETGLFWTPLRKINSTSYTYGIRGQSYSFDTSSNLGLELNQFQWEDSYFPVGFGMALKLFFEIDSLKISAKRCAIFYMIIIEPPDKALKLKFCPKKQMKTISIIYLDFVNSTT